MISTRRHPSQSRLRQLLDYNGETGVFRWLIPRGSAKKEWFPGSVHNMGYRTIRIDGELYLAHRLAWVFVHGDEQAPEIDHINGEPSDNRIENLHRTTREGNTRNVKKGKNNTSGVHGVCWDKSRLKWTAQLSMGGRHIHLGRFASIADAAAARRVAETKYHGEFAAHLRAA